VVASGWLYIVNVIPNASSVKQFEECRELSLHPAYFFRSFFIFLNTTKIFQLHLPEGNPRPALHHQPPSRCGAPAPVPGSVSDPELAALLQGRFGPNEYRVALAGPERVARGPHRRPTKPMSIGCCSRWVAPKGLFALWFSRNLASTLGCSRFATRVSLARIQGREAWWGGGSGPLGALADHQVDDAGRCVTRHSFALGTAGAYEVRGGRGR